MGRVRWANLLQASLTGADSLLPQFFGLYCYSSTNRNIRFVVMNNLLPSRFKYSLKYDLKGGFFRVGEAAEVRACKGA